MVQREAGEVVEQVNGKQPASNRLATMLLVNPMSRLPGSIKLAIRARQAGAQQHRQDGQFSP